MSNFNTGTIKLDFRDARREPIKTPVTLTFDNFHVKSLNFRVTLAAFPHRLSVAAFPTGLWTVHIQPEHYRAKSLFVSVPSGGEVQLQEVFLLSPARAKPVFPTVSKIFSDPVWQSFADFLNRSSIAGLSGRDLYSQLVKKEPLKAAGLLNLQARTRAVRLSNGQDVFAGLEELIEIRQERLYSLASDSLHTDVKKSVSARIFEKANGTLHDFPPGFRLLKKDASFKTPEAAGNLQLTFAENDNELVLVDVDMDEARGIQHAFEVLHHLFTGAKTHPYDIHQILTFFYENIDPGYLLEPK